MLGRLQAADLDGDGRPDVVAAVPGGSPTPALVFTNLNGQLLPGVPVGDASAGATDVAVGDLNGDGQLDIVTAHINDERLGVFFNTGHAFGSRSVTGWRAARAR